MNYRIDALDVSGRLVKIELPASTPEDAARIGAERGLQVLRVRAASLTGWRSLLRVNLSAKFPLHLFNQELLTLFDAGLLVVEALDVLIEKESREEVREVLRSVLASLREGASLSDALVPHRQAFPPLYVETIRSGERSGNLQQALRRYIAYQAQVDQLRKKILTASVYPLLLIAVGALVVLFLLAYVIPKFSQILNETGRDLSFASRLLLSLGENIDRHGAAFGVASVAVVGGLAFGLARPEFRAWLREGSWNVPVLGERMRVYQLSRFYRALAMLLNAGIPLMSALSQVGGILDLRMQKRLAAARHAIGTGQQLSIALEEAGLSTVIASRLLRVGERSGQMGAMLERVAEFHEDELNRWIDWASRLFEPLLMVFIGLIIGAVIVLMYMPIFELAGSVQ